MTHARVREHILEQAFAADVGAPQAVAAASGAAALALGLASAGVMAGHDVLVSALASPRVLEAAALIGARPIFADVDPFTLTLDPRRVAESLTDRTRAVVAEHAAGVPCDVEGLAAACGSRRIAVVEDGTDAANATVRGRPIGAHGRPAAFALGALGLLALPDAGRADLVRGLRGTLALETNEADAGAALTDLKSRSAGAAARAALGLYLRRALVGRPGLVLPVLDAGLPGERAWPRFVVQVPAAQRDRALRALAVRGVGAAPLPPARAPLPVAADVAARALAIDLDPGLDGPAAERFVADVRAALS